MSLGYVSAQGCHTHILAAVTCAIFTLFITGHLRHSEVIRHGS